MRVIAGKAKGRNLAAPKGRITRPTSDRVREALFSILQVRVPGSRVLDLYAGSGALGIEALSRGAGAATFVDRDVRAVAIIRMNLAACGFGHQATILRDDVLRALRALAARGETFDLVFFDPPYVSEERARCWPALPAVLSDDGIVIVEEPAKGGPATGPSSEAGAVERSDLGLVLRDRRVYGGTALAFHGRAGFTGARGN